MNPISVWVKSNTLTVKLIALGTIITALVGFHYYDRHQHSQKAVKAAIYALNASYQIQLNAQIAKARVTEDKIRDTSKKEQDVKDQTIKVVNGKLDVALSELRKRASRPSPTGNPQIAGVVETCTGRELYREDGEFLARLAAEADTAVIWRDYYYREYENARKALDEAAK